MVLLYIMCAVLISVVIYLAIVYYFLFCKEKPLRERSGIFTVTDPELYFPNAKKSNTTGKLAVTGLFVLPIRKHRHDKQDQERKEEHREEAFPKTHTSVGTDNIYFTDEEKKTDDVRDILCEHSKEDKKEEKSVHFEDEPMTHSTIDDHSSTYQRSEDVDHGYGTLSIDTDRGSVSWGSD